MTEHDGIDRKALDNLAESVGGDREFMAELLTSFLDDAPVQLEEMRTALGTADSERLRRSAHSLKSNSATFGAIEVSHQCKEVEEMAKAVAWDGVSTRIEYIAAAYEEVKPVLEAIVRDK